MSNGLHTRLLERLYLARLALEAGREAASEPLPFSRMRAVMALDDAAEWAVVALLGEVGLRPKRDAALQEHLVALAEKKPELARHQGPLERLRALRNRVKHDGVIPSLEDARGAAADVDSFLRDALKAVLGKSLEEISPVELISDDVPKGHLVAALEALERGDYEAAVTGAARAFALAETRFFEKLSPFYRFRLEDDRFVRDLFGAIAAAATSAAPQSSPQADARQEVRKFASAFAERLKREGSFSGRRLLERLTRPARLARFGIDLADLRRFEEITPHVLAFIGGEKTEVHHDRALHSTPEDAVFAIDFATRAVLLLEDWQQRNPRHLR